MSDAGIRYIDFTPGAEAVHYRCLPDIGQRIAKLAMPDEPDFWRWGQFRRSIGDYRAHVESGFAALAAYLTRSGVSVDQVVLCAPCVNDCGEFVEAVRALQLPGIRLDDAALVEGTDCVNLIAALDLARRQIAAGAREVLVLATEKVAKETWRFKKFSLFSDYSMAILVSADLDACRYAIVDVLVQPDPQPGQDTGSILARTLEKSCLGQLLGRNRLSVQELGKFCYIHLYEPMYQMKGKDLGFDLGRMATAGIAELGHCYGADPFIDMIRHFDAPPPAVAGLPALLCASSRQYAGMALIRDRPVAAECSDAQ